MAALGKHIEDCSFEMPNIKDGVQQLGDLWDCTTDTTIRLNNLEKEYLIFKGCNIKLQQLQPKLK